MDEVKTITVEIAPGQQVFEFDMRAGKINYLPWSNPMRKGKAKSVKKKVLYREGCLYCAALGMESAVKQFAIMYEEGIADGTIVRPGKPKKTPFEASLCLNNNWEPENMAIEMFQVFTDHPSEDSPVWALLEATGDAEYTRDTFLKAAKIILNKD